MKIEVRFFASLKETAGCSGLSLEMSRGADFAELCRQLVDRFGAATVEALLAPNVRIARNQTLEDPPFTLTDGDEVAFLPPVTGG